MHLGKIVLGQRVLRLNLLGRFQRIVCSASLVFSVQAFAVEERRLGFLQPYIHHLVAKIHATRTSRTGKANGATTRTPVAPCDPLAMPTKSQPS
jgi:hypothetical protein